MTIVNQGRQHLLWVTPNSCLDLDYGGLARTVAGVILPHAPNLTIADCFPSHAAKFVYPVWFSAGRCHRVQDVPQGSVAFARQRGGVAQNGFQFNPIIIYVDEAFGRSTGDRRYAVAARVIAHEFAHLFGAEHTGLKRDLMYSDSSVESWYTVSPTVSSLWRMYLS